MYIFYSNVPVYQILFNFTISYVGFEDEPIKIMSFFNSNFKAKFDIGETYVPLNGKKLKNCIMNCVEAYEEKFENVL